MPTCSGCDKAISVVLALYHSSVLRIYFTPTHSSSHLHGIGLSSRHRPHSLVATAAVQSFPRSTICSNTNITGTAGSLSIEDKGLVIGRLSTVMAHQCPPSVRAPAVIRINSPAPRTLLAVDWPHRLAVLSKSRPDAVQPFNHSDGNSRNQMSRTRSSDR